MAIKECDIIPMHPPVHLERLIGRIATVSSDAPSIDKHLGTNGFLSERMLLDQQYYGLKLIFCEELPHLFKNNWFYCLKEVGKEATDDLHWYTLDQLDLVKHEI